MAQVTIYLDDETESKVKKAAESAGMSVSRWIATVLRDRSDNSWPPEVLALIGAWPDFPSLEELRAGYGPDIEREQM